MRATKNSLAVPYLGLERGSSVPAGLKFLTLSLCSRSITLLQSITPAKWYDKLNAAHLALTQTGPLLDHPFKDRITLC
ncbi:MAG TPA: hypothetical protein VJ760_02805 [Nitrospiraceae bacterium]|nr:hypothetical protein [Nitrospiraceae bacterium]